MSKTNPARYADAVTPNDNADLPRQARQILVAGTVGDVKVTTMLDEVVTIKAAWITAYNPFVLEVKKVHATGTTATDIVAMG